MVLIPIALTLIAITAGMFLLAKTNKDNLGILFKIVAYFIIISGFLNLACSAMMCMMGFYGKHHFNGEMKMHNKWMKHNMELYHHNMGMGMRNEGYWNSNGNCNEKNYGCDDGCNREKSNRCYTMGGCCKTEKDSCSDECRKMKERK